MASIFVDNRKVKGGTLSSPGNNTNLYYRRAEDAFKIVGSYNNLETLFDWLLINSKESKYVKSGTANMNSDRHFVTIEFKSPFINNDYYLFYLSSGNVNLYTINKRSARFTIGSSFSVSEEISWFAIHKKLAHKTGISNPGSIYAGSRSIAEDYENDLLRPNGDIYESLDINNNNHSNLSGWYNSEFIIRPTNELDDIVQDMDMSDYSVLLSSNSNINIFWNQKEENKVKISTSFPQTCIIDYLFVREGVNWWDEL